MSTWCGWDSEPERGIKGLPPPTPHSDLNMILFLVLSLGAVSANVGTDKESLRLSIGQSGLDFASDVSAHMLTELEKFAAGGLSLGTES